MSETLPPCPQCSSVYTYELGALLVCPECAHEWAPGDAADGDDGDGERVYKDAYGTVLADGDTVTVVKDLKFRGGTIKVGTKVTNIRLVDATDDHDIDCRVPGIGAMQLKSSVVKKA